jgi:SAM-dependent methyltransferase
MTSPHIVDVKAANASGQLMSQISADISANFTTLESSTADSTRNLLRNPSAHRIQWRAVNCCPACGSYECTVHSLPESGYVFGDEHIAFPTGGIAVATCSSCALVYKTVLPEPTSLAQVFERQAGKKWMEPYDFHDETLELQRFVGDRADLLDIGSGAGALLKAWSQWSLGGRRSALDIVEHPGGARYIDGEFIRGLIDSDSLSWSEKPYDIVTLFDVMEHLYDPQNAFRNLRSLVKDNGLVVMESGNVASEWPVRYGAHHWWYVRLFEHHVFWSRASLQAMAEKFGFRLLIWRELRHKAHGTLPLLRRINDSAQVALYRLNPKLYPKIGPLVGKYWTQPWSPFVADHFRVVLRKL